MKKESAARVVYIAAMAAAALAMAALIHFANHRPDPDGAGRADAAILRPDTCAGPGSSRDGVPPVLADGPGLEGGRALVTPRGEGSGRP